MPLVLLGIKMELVAPHHDCTKFDAKLVNWRTSQTSSSRCRKPPTAGLPGGPRPLLALALAATAFSVATNTPIIVSASLDLTLAFGADSAASHPSATSQHEPVASQHEQPINSFVGREQDLHRLMSDELVGEEFRQTGAALQFVAQALEQFAVAEHLDSARASEGHLVTRWLQELGGDGAASQQVVAALSELGKSNAGQLDLVYATFWSKFKPLLELVVGEKPASGLQLSDDLAFRCTRYSELAQLQQMASSSSIYRFLFDIFGSDLYIHCLRRKLAMVKIHRVFPSSVLRQFVDIYLNLPAHYSRLQLQFGNHLDEATDRSIWEITASLALRFDANESLKWHGSLEQAASLVFGDSSFSLGGSSFSLGAREAAMLVEKFKHDCQEHTNQLGQIWGKFDEVASFLSSPMNNLADFNQRIKLAAPPLVYGSVCGRLATSS